MAQKKHSALDARTTRQAGYVISQQKRKRIEEIFGWLKTVGMLRKTRHKGLLRAGWVFTFVATTYNLVRIRNWRLARRAPEEWCVCTARKGQTGTRASRIGSKVRQVMSSDSHSRQLSKEELGSESRLFRHPARVLLQLLRYSDDYLIADQSGVLNAYSITKFATSDRNCWNRLIVVVSRAFIISPSTVS